MSEIERKCLIECMKYITYNSSSQEMSRLMDLLKELELDWENITSKNNDIHELKSLLREWLQFYLIVLYEYEDTLKTSYTVQLRERTLRAIGGEG